MEDEERDSPWNFHTCKSCSYRSKSAFLMCKHVRLHRTRPKTDVFLCDSKTPEMLECEFCEFYTDLKVNLCEHFRVFHEEKYGSTELQNILKQWRCPKCHFKTHSLLVLTNHTGDCDIAFENNSQPRGTHVALNSSKKKRKKRQKKEMKRHCCCFCSKLVTCIGRHLQHKHRNEPEIGRILILPSFEKKRELKKLRLQGDKAYNITVEPNKRIPVRKSNFQTISQSIECLKCNALIGRHYFSNHARRCFGTSVSVIEDNNSAQSLPGPSSAVTRKTKPSEKHKERYIKKPEEGKCKRHFCCFCSKLVTTMTRHLLYTHKDEPEIIRISNLPSSDRVKEVKKLRLRGDKIYNGTAKPHKRIRVRVPFYQQTSSIECSNCSALVCRRSFSKHERRCTGRPPRKRRRRFEDETQLDTLLLGDMEVDEIGRTARNDATIKLLGVYYLEESNRKNCGLVSAKAQIRKCARLLLTVKNLDPTINELKDCITPEKYAVLMEAIKNLCNFDGTRFRNSAAALQFGPLLSRVCAVLKAEYLKSVPLSDPQIQTLDGFINLHRSDFKMNIAGRILSEWKEKALLAVELDEPAES